MMSTMEAMMAQMRNGGAGAAGAMIQCGGPTAWGDKVTIVGGGSLATATLFAVIAQGVSKNIVLIDNHLENIQKELSDIEDAALYMGDPKMTFTSDWESCRDSRVIILAVGEKGTEPVVNVRLLQVAVPRLVSACPGCVLLVATLPSDILAWATWRLSALPAHRVIGIGCTLQTSRLRRTVARRLRVAPSAISAIVLGRRTVAWNTLTACGVRLRDVNPRLGAEDDPEDWANSLENVLSAPQLRAIGSTAAHIAGIIVKDSRDCLPIATHVSGCRQSPDPNKDVYMSLPCVLGHAGVAYIVRQALSQEEKDELQYAADTLNELQCNLELL